VGSGALVFAISLYYKKGIMAPGAKKKAKPKAKAKVKAKAKKKVKAKAKAKVKAKAKKKVKVKAKVKAEKKAKAKAGPWKNRCPKAKASEGMPHEAWPPKASRPVLIDPPTLLKRVLEGHDAFFLSRQVAYRVSITSQLAKVWADASEAMSILTSLINHLAIRSPRRSSISIGIADFSLRSGRGVEFSFRAIDRYLKAGEHKALMSGLFDGSADSHTGVSLSNLREHVIHQHGRFWADHVGQNTLTYHIVFPSSKEVAHLQLAGQRAFRYDISITNYSVIRKRFGIRKGKHLVEQVENYVKSLVRFPIDMVSADLDRGVITTVYETQHGAAESVPARISKRLGSEVFHIGRRAIDLQFRYELTTLSKRSAGGGGARRGSR